MKHLNYYLLSYCLGALLFSCNMQPSTETIAETTKESTVSFFSDAYKAPVFVNDERKEKIKTIGSKLHALIEEHAKGKNIPGIAYGIVVDNELVISSATGLINIETSAPATPLS